MKIITHETKGVRPDGTVKSGGSVVVSGSIRMSIKQGGCALKGCNCSNGHWLTIVLPRKRGVVKAVCVQFDNQREMDKFLTNRIIDL